MQPLDLAFHEQTTAAEADKVLESVEALDEIFSIPDESVREIRDAATGLPFPTDARDHALAVNQRIVAYEFI